MLPFVASFLQELGEPRLSIAGLVIGGYAVGGLFYAATVSRLVGALRRQHLMVIGAVFISSQIAIIAFGPPWQVQFLNFAVMGCGFYLIHGGFQVFTSEIAPDARATRGVAAGVLLQLRSVFGPLLFGFGLTFCGQGADAAHGRGAVAVGRHPVRKAVASPASARRRAASTSPRSPDQPRPR